MIVLLCGSGFQPDLHDRLKPVPQVQWRLNPAPVESHSLPRYNGRAVTEDGHAPPETFLCVRCATECEPEDNFCRHCGLPLRDPQLPSIRDGHNVPAVWRPQVPAVVRGAAVVAAGTVAEIVVRRLVRAFLGRRPNDRREAGPPARSAKGEVVPREDRMPEDAQMVSETLLLRRIRFRR